MSAETPMDPTPMAATVRLENRRPKSASTIVLANGRAAVNQSRDSISTLENACRIYIDGPKETMQAND
jgi:hypothetical protein